MAGKPYTCSYCGQTFEETSAFLAHERTHIGERRYECSQCGGTYPCHSDLLIHRKSHVGEKPRRCASDGGRGSGRNAPLHRLAEEFGFESGEEDEGLGGSAQDAQPQPPLQQAPQKQPGNPDIKCEAGDVWPQPRTCPFLLHRSFRNPVLECCRQEYYVELFL
ncbi:UNVERIFIED_CONTAM: hypothetical protein K2H54_066736 [Gekko kuhli]